MKKILILMVLIVSAAITPAFAEQAYDAAYAEPGLFPERLYSPTPHTSSEAKRAPRTLSAKQQLMNYLCEQLKSCPETINVSAFRIGTAKNPNADISYDDFSDIYFSAVWFTPEAGKILTAFSYFYSESTQLISRVKPIYVTAPYDAEEFEAQIKYILSRVVSPEMDDTQKLLALHDYLADTCVYNKAATNKALDPADEASYAYTAYGAIVNKSCVCQGYSFAFKLLCDRLGIDCGYATNPGHMWNIARAADGNYYHIDITFDDPLITSANGGYAYEPDGVTPLQSVYHRYFLTNDQTIFAAHTDTKYTETADTVQTSYDTDTQRLRITKELASGFDWHNRHGVMLWQDGEFWQLCRGEGSYFYSGYTYKPLRYTSSGIKEVARSEFPTERKLSGQIFNVNNGYVAMRGAPGGDAVLYEAEYDGSTLKSAKSTRVTFDGKGRAFADVQNPGSKLMLISDELTPTAYSRSGNMTIWE